MSRNPIFPAFVRGSYESEVRNLHRAPSFCFQCFLRFQGKTNNNTNNTTSVKAIKNVTKPYISSIREG